MRYVLAVDGGNTKTVAIVARLDGTIAGFGRGGCGDIYGAGRADRALTAVEAAVHAALGVAGVAAEGITAGVFSMAGADWPEDFDFLRSAMEQRGFGERVIVVNDALGALRAGSPDGAGVVVACGTGAAIGARAPDGRVWHTSFWQEFGGAHHLGDRTLRAVYRAELGLDEPTSLTARVLAYYGQATVEDVLHARTARENAAPSPAPLTRLLLDEADNGDAMARRIVQGHGIGLGEYAAVAARQVGLAGAPFTLVLVGGVLRHPSSLLRDALVARVRQASPDVRVVVSRFEPVVGALFLALEAVGVGVDEAVVARMLPTSPPATLFAT